MAEYNITVELTGITLASMTGPQIVDALHVLEGAALSEYTADINALVETSAGTVVMTGTEIVNAINSLAGVDPKILYGQLSAIPKARILHGENCLNWIGTSDPRISAFQALFLTPNTDRIKKMDFIITTGITTSSTIFQNGDWVIALADNPGFDYADTAKWLIMPFSKIAQIVIPVFKKHIDTASAGIESILGGSTAYGIHSFAPNQLTYAEGQASSAFGYRSKSKRFGDIAESSGVFSVTGDSQRTRSQLRLTTLNATQTLMVTPARYEFDANKSYLLKIIILAVVAGGKKAKTWEYKFITGIDTDGYVPAAGGIVAEGVGSDDIALNYGNPAVNVAVSITTSSVDNPPEAGSFKGLQIQCTGIANTQVFWEAFIEAFECGSLTVTGGGGTS